MAATDGPLLLSCEHGGNRVPREYRYLFGGKQALLRSHRGWDAGALLVARALARSLRAPLLAARTTRLLADLNRSPHNPKVFSEVTRPLARSARARLLDRHHRPHWDRVLAVASARRGTTLHVAVHSFTPILDGDVRSFRVGLLYDPGRPRERSFAIDWQRRLRDHLPRRDVRRNAPYRGDADGLTTALRRRLPARRYVGLELELNQGAISAPAARRALVSVLADSLRSVAARYA